MSMQKLQILLKSQKLDALFVSNFYNILYLTGFKTFAPEEREAFAVVTLKNIYVITDGRYISNENENDGITNRMLTSKKRLIQQLEEIIKEEKLKTLGFEAEDLKFHEHKAFKKKLSVKLVPTERIIAQLRTIKDQQEIVKIKRACTIADQCLREIIKTVKIGQTEKEIAFKIEFWLKQKGFDISFQPTVAVNENAAIPHYNTQAGNGKIKRGSLLLVDFGAKVDDYCSDCTRVFFIGKPTDSLAKVYNKLLDVQGKTIELISKRHSRSDRESDPRFREDDRGTLKSIDLFCRNQLKKNGLPNFPHSTGHGVGLEVHESPSVSFKSKDKLQVGQVFTIEPGIYIEGKYGMRIEDMIWVKDKSIETTTKLPKQISSLIL